MIRAAGFPDDVAAVRDLSRVPYVPANCGIEGAQIAAAITAGGRYQWTSQWRPSPGSGFARSATSKTSHSLAVA